MSQKVPRKRPESHYAIRTHQNQDLSQQTIDIGENKRKQRLRTQSHNTERHRHNFSELNLSFHNPQKCVCCKCECGTHKCKISCQKPEIHKSTTYTKSYKKSRYSTFKHTKVQFIPKKLKSIVVDMQTTYNQKYTLQKNDQTPSLKENDHVGFNGEITNLTSYAQNYPGFKGANQYVKPKPDIFRGGLKFYGNSTYSAQYLNRSTSVQQSAKPESHLRSGSLWIGQSSYKNNFKNSNSEFCRPKVNFKPQQKYNKLNNTSTQFDTSYKTNFINKQGINLICPAKSLLMNQLKNSQRRG